jgi:hypothetical protein
VVARYWEELQRWPDDVLTEAVENGWRGSKGFFPGLDKLDGDCVALAKRKKQAAEPILGEGDPWSDNGGPEAARKIRERLAAMDDGVDLGEVGS